VNAVELTGYEGLQSLRYVQVARPRPMDDEILIQVRAAGINFSELELTHGRYRVPKEPPFVMGFEAAGVIAEVGSRVTGFKEGDRVVSVVSSGGYAEYATAKADFAIPIPDAVSFAEATTIPIQGLSAYALLKFAAKLQPSDTVLIQAAAGGVGVYLVQLARIMGAKKIIALASSQTKLDLLSQLGVDVVVDYSKPDWPNLVMQATAGVGAELVLESASGQVGDESFRLLAPFGRMVIYGAKNVHDTFLPEKIQQLIYKNQSVVGFNFPSLLPGQIAECLPPLLQLISTRKLKLFAPYSFPLKDVASAFESLSSRRTIGKVVLVP